MDEAEWRSRGESFGALASGYADHRPDYPVEAVTWLLGTSHARVLELGAGTGKLTRLMLSLGHDVIASDPAPEMLRRLRRDNSAARITAGKAEDIPLRPSSVDVVVVAQAYHWFDAARALPEIARVLRPGGTFALVWNRPDRKVPWVRRVFDAIGTYGLADDQDPLADSDLFAPSESRFIRHWQRVNREGLLGFAESTSSVARMSADERRKVLEDLGAVYDDYGRGPDGMQLPWITQCFRTRVTGLARPTPPTPPPPDDGFLIDLD